MNVPAWVLAGPFRYILEHLTAPETPRKLRHN